MFTFNTYGQVGFFNTNNSGNYATALGYESIATGSHSTALALELRQLVDNRLPQDTGATLKDYTPFALGARAIASETHAMAFGLDVSAYKKISNGNWLWS